MLKDIYQLSRSDKFFLKPGEESSVDLTLEKTPPFPCTKLCGQVIGGKEPVCGATVKVFDTNLKPLCHTETDCQGDFSLIDTLTPGSYNIVAAAKGFFTSESSLISLRPNQISSIKIRLNPDKNTVLGTVYGVVRDEKNKPLPSTQIYLFNVNDMVHSVAVTNSNADGEYLIYGINPGSYNIVAFQRGYFFPEKIGVSLLSGEITNADIYLYISEEATKGTISGKVLYQHETVPYALTALYRIYGNCCTLIQIQYANSKGLYLFSNLPSGKYIVKAKLESDYINICGNADLE